MSDGLAGDVLVRSASISGGSVSNDLSTAYSSVGGGYIGGDLSVYFGESSISDGHIAGDLDVGYPHVRNRPDSDAEMKITGGRIDGDITVGTNSELAISGGEINADKVYMSLQSRLLISGSDFAIDGVPIHGPVYDGRIWLPTRALTLSGRLADGSSFEFAINERDRYRFGNDVQTDWNGHVILLLPEPSSVMITGLAIVCGAIRSRMISRRACSRSRQ